MFVCSALFFALFLPIFLYFALLKELFPLMFLFSALFLALFLTIFLYFALFLELFIDLLIVIYFF